MSAVASHGALSVPGCPGRTVLAWEHGGNLGHLSRLRAVAAVLQGLGGELLWAVPRHRAPEVMGVVGGGNVVAHVPQFPTCPTAGTTLSYADVLLRLGFADVGAVQQAVRAWLNIFSSPSQTASVARVVIDYAPAAQLAAMVAGIPALQLTNGFDAPPASCPSFGWGLRGDYVERKNQALVARLDAIVTAVLRSFGVAGGLSEMLTYPTRLLDTVPDLDPYGVRSELVPIGPMGTPSRVVSPSWPTGGRAPRVFVYLRDSMAQEQVLACLQELGCHTLSFCPGLSPHLAERFCKGFFHSSEPVDIAKALDEADAVISYGSSTLACQALLAGCPQLLIPTDIEKALVAARVESLGIGRSIRGSLELRGEVARFTEGGFREAARAASARYAQLDWKQSLALAINCH